MQKKSFYITGADGHNIPMYAWLPNEPPLCVLHIAHGLAEYAERYETIAAIVSYRSAYSAMPCAMCKTHNGDVSGSHEYMGMLWPSVPVM